MIGSAYDRVRLNSRLKYVNNVHSCSLNMNRIMEGQRCLLVNNVIYR